MIEPPIRTNFHWPDEFRNIVTGYPVGAHCAGEYGCCDNRVVYHADFHGCQQELLCASHLDEWCALAINKMVTYGSVICTACGRESRVLSGAVTVRPA